MKYSAEDAGDSSGVSSRGRCVDVPGKKAVSLDSFDELSRGGVGGLAMKGPRTGATSTIVQ